MKSAYFWRHVETKMLTDLWRQGEHNIEILASQLGRKPEAVRKKLQRLGLVVVRKTEISQQTNEEEKTKAELELPSDLPSIEEALKLLVAAMHALSKTGLTKVEIQRALGIVKTVKVYQKLIGEYCEYRKVEAELARWEAKFAESEKMERNRPLKSRYTRMKRAWPRLPRIATLSHPPRGLRSETNIVASHVTKQTMRGNSEKTSNHNVENMQKDGRMEK